MTSVLHTAWISNDERVLSRSNQSIKTGIELSIDKSIKIGECDLIDTYRSKSMTNSFRSSIYLDFYRFHRYISEHTSLYQELKTEFMQTVNVLTIELQLRVEGSNSYHYKKKIKKILSFL